MDELLCPMKFAKNTSDDSCDGKLCAWFIPPVMENKTGACAIHTLGFGTIIKDAITLFETSIKKD